MVVCGLDRNRDGSPSHPLPSFWGLQRLQINSYTDRSTSQSIQQIF
jgi:hypothetical protein